MFCCFSFSASSSFCVVIVLALALALVIVLVLLVVNSDCRDHDYYYGVVNVVMPACGHDLSAYVWRLPEVKSMAHIIKALG